MIAVVFHYVLIVLRMKFAERWGRWTICNIRCGGFI